MRGNYSLHQPPDQLVTDPYWANVVYYSRYESGITEDLSGVNVVTTTGTPVQSSTAKKFGTYSYWHPGGANYLNIRTANNGKFAFGTGDFTVEYWIYFNGAPGNNNNFGGFCINNAVNTSPGGTWSIYQGNTSTSKYKVGWYNGTTVTQYMYPTELTYQTWYHVAYYRISGTQYVAVNGVPANLGSNTQNIGTSGGTFFGTDYYNEYNIGIYYDEVRVTFGIARYGANNFNPPEKSFPTPTLP